MWIICPGFATFQNAVYNLFKKGIHLVDIHQCMSEWLPVVHALWTCHPKCRYADMNLIRHSCRIKFMYRFKVDFWTLRFWVLRWQLWGRMNVTSRTGQSNTKPKLSQVAAGGAGCNARKSADETLNTPFFCPTNETWPGRTTSPHFVAKFRLFVL